MFDDTYSNEVIEMNHRAFVSAKITHSHNMTQKTGARVQHGAGWQLSIMRMCILDT